MKRFTYAFGVGMAVLMALSMVLPMITRTQSRTVQPTTVAPTALPTFPPPLASDAISFDQTYLHPSGLFTVAEPTGWIASQPQTTKDSARALLTNTTAQSLVQVDVDRPVTATDQPVTLDDVNARFNAAWLGSSWSQYSTWKESDRERTSDNRLVIDFELTAKGQTYVARQEAWTDGDWIYSVRVVTPSNATDMLRYVLDGEVASLKPQKEFAGTPFNWKAYFDPQDLHIIRFPFNWSLSDSAPGRPTSITTDNTALRVEAQTGTVVDSQDAASTWVQNLRPGTDILSVKPVDHDGANGFSVAYTFKTVDGDTNSGLAVLLNGPNDMLHVANLQFPASSVDLNNTDSQANYSDLVDTMNSFTVLPQLAGVDTGPAASTTTATTAASTTSAASN